MNPQGSNLAPSAPPPSAPPSYEEAMANAGGVPIPPVSSVPYPVGPATMPMPAYLSQPAIHMPPTPPYPIGPPGMPMAMPVAPYNRGSAQTTIPMPPNYSGPSESTGQSQVPQTADANFGRPMQVRVIHHHVMSLGPNPVKMSCPTCQADIKTTTISDHQPSAHICCIALFFLGCCLCSCLPYCMNAFRSIHHFCPNCKNYIGTWKG